MMHFVLTDVTLLRLGSALLHFLWQGAVLAAISAVALRLLVRRSAEARYAVAVGALLIMAAAPVLTFVFNSTISTMTRAAVVMAANAIAPATVSTRVPAPLIDWNAWMPFILLLWFTGVGLSTARLTASWWITLRLRRTAESILPGSIGEMFRSLTSQMGFVRSVMLMKSRRISTPLAVGWIRPVVLLPVRAFTGLDEDQLRAVLAHELAHIRRHDFLVNVLQRCVESFLFYHPGVWWLSARIRAEREHCCDDLAVRMCGDPLIYAQALVQMEQERGGAPQVAMAAGGTGLTSRVLRVLGRDSRRGDWREAVLVWICLLAIVSGSVLPSRPAIAQPVVAPVPSKSVTTEAQAILPTARALLLALAEPQTATQPGTKEDTGSIEGIVVRLGTDQPVARAFVTVYPEDLSSMLPGVPPGLPTKDPTFIAGFLDGAMASSADETRALLNGIRKTAETDENGKFTLTGIKPGRYRLAATRNGFVRSEYRQRRPGSPGASLVVVNGQTIKDLRLVILPAAAITGRVYDSHNEPLRNVLVRALQDAYENGARRLRTVQETRTNDLGDYRLSDLQPGRYFISASFAPSGTQARIDYVSDRTVATISTGLPANPRDLPATPGGRAYRAVLYPNATDAAGAVPIEVAPANEVRAANLTLLDFGTVRVSGRVAIGGPYTVPFPLLTLTSRQGDPATRPAPQTTMPHNGGNFEFADVLPGPYVLTASTSGGLRAGATAPRMGVSVLIDVPPTGMKDLALVLQPGFDIPGKVETQGAVDKGIAFVSLEALESQSGQGFAVRDDGAFTLKGTLPGEYRFSIMGLPPSAYLKSAVLEGKDLLSGPIRIDAAPAGQIEVVLSGNVGRVEARALTDKRDPAVGVTVVLIPDAPFRQRFDLYRSALTDSEGRVLFESIMPGNYKAFAWEDVEDGSWMSPDFLRNYESRGRSLRITEGANSGFELTAIP